MLKLYIAYLSTMSNGSVENMNLQAIRLKLSIFITCLFLITTSVFASDKVLVKDSRVTTNGRSVTGEEVFLNKIDQSEEHRDNKTFQVATIIIEATPAAVFKTFTDYDRSAQIFSYLKKAKIISVNGPKKTISCEAEVAGGLFKFQYVLEFTETAPNLVQWHRVSGAFKANEGYWKFEPVGKGDFTLVTYSKYVDAGFLFPQFLVKKELHDDMPVILRELKNSVESSSN